MSFRRITLQDKAALLTLVRRFCAGIEEGVEILGGSLGSESFRPIDLLARDAAGRALLIFADVRPDPSALLNAAAQAEWTVRNRSLLGQLFPSLGITKDAPPRAALIYPEFPLLLKRFVRAALPSPPPLLFRYRCFEAPVGRFLDLERWRPECAVPAGGGPEAGDLPPFRTGGTGDDVEISMEEREAFLS